jgi:hypothetical protein
MATTKRRLRHARQFRGLSAGERNELLHGIVFAAEEGFASKEAMLKAWQAHKATLMLECKAGMRPMAFWELENGVGYPNCAANDYEPEIDCLMRLGLEVTHEERVTLLAAEPPHIPESVPLSAVEHWKQVLRSIGTREEWHRREGRHTQAGLWREQFVALHSRIETATPRAGEKPQSTDS